MEKISEIEIVYKSTVKKSDRFKVTNSKDAFNVILSLWNKDNIELLEEFKVLFLNRANEVLGIHTLSKGGISGTVVDIRLLFAIALKSAASSIILVHNHPSGNLNPSQADIQLFNKIKEASRFLDINVLDNLIISKDDYYSCNDQ